MPEWLKLALTIVGSIIASSGFWAFLQSIRDKKSVQSKMLLGLAHDRIIFLGTKYIEDGYISHGDFENLVDYLYEPYHKMGGNGTAQRIIDEVKKLPLRKDPYEDKE